MNRFHRNSLPQILTKEVLTYLYLHEKYSAQEIAKSLKVNKHNVIVYLKKHNIQHVERWERYKVKSFTTSQKDYLYGSLLGDDSLRFGNKRKYPFLQVIHSSKFYDYVEWKHQVWKPLVPGGIKQGFSKLGKKKFSIHRFYTAAHPDFLPFYKLIYKKSDHKAVSSEWLDQLTPLSLAVWFMDDGYFRRERNRIHYYGFAFGHEGNKLIKKYFADKWKLKANLGHQKKKKNLGWFIWFNTENSIKLSKIIAPHMLPVFDYKINRTAELRWHKMVDGEVDFIKQ